MKIKRLFELKSDRRGKYNGGVKVEPKVEPKKKPAPKKDKKK